MDIEKRIALVKEVGEEILTEEDLRELFQKKEHPIAYDGFEPSGKMHLAQGVLRAINVNKMILAGCKFKMFVADWHAWANNKMGGDLEKIHRTGEYLIEIWKACGMDVKNVEFVWGSALAKDTEYWKKVMQIARNSTLQRILRCSQIMGRSEKDALSAAQIFYPCMQAADIFYLGADIAQLGMDQRKVNVLAREIGPKLGLWKPVAVHHHMLMGLGQPKVNTEKKRYTLTSEYTEIDNGSKLKIISFENWSLKFKIGVDEASVKHEPFTVKLEYVSHNGKRQTITITEGNYESRDDFGIELIRANPDKNAEVEIETKKSPMERAIAMKMSKSIPDSAIFMTDSEDEIKRKIGKAYCPEKQVEENPSIEYSKYLVFEKFGKMKIERPAKFGGDLELKSFDDLKTQYSLGKIHPMDLKAAVARSINEMVAPVREHFEKNAKARELKEQVESFGVTR